MKTRIHSFLVGVLSTVLVLSMFGLATAAPDTAPDAAPTIAPSSEPVEGPGTVVLKDRTPNQYMMVMAGYEHDEESDLTFAVFKLNDAGKLALLLYQSEDVYRFEEALEILHNPAGYKRYQVRDAEFYLRLAMERLRPFHGNGCDYSRLERAQLITEAEQAAQTDEYHAYAGALKPFAGLAHDPVILMATYTQEELAEYYTALAQAMYYYRPDYLTWINEMTFRLPVPSET